MTDRAAVVPMNAKQFASVTQRAELFSELVRDLGVFERGQSVALARALEDAFSAGATLAQSNAGFACNERGAPQIIEFDDLPHDAQDGFALLTTLAGLDHPGDHPLRQPSPVVLRAFHTSDGKRSWWAELPTRATEARWSHWVVLTLERFGLITALPNNPGRSTLTHRAIVLMQTGRASRDVPATAAWERNARARDVEVQTRREPALV